MSTGTLVESSRLVRAEGRFVSNMVLIIRGRLEIFSLSLLLNIPNID